MDLSAILYQIGVCKTYYTSGNTLHNVFAMSVEQPPAVYQPHVEGNEETGFYIRYQLSAVVQGIRPPIGTLWALDLSIVRTLTQTFTPPFAEELRVTGCLPNAQSPMSPRMAVYEPVVIGNGIQAFYVMYVARHSVRTLYRNPLAGDGNPAA